MAWSQTDEEVEVTIALPKGVRSRDITVTIKSSLIQVRLKNGYSMDEEEEGKNQSGETLLKKIQSGLTLFLEVNPDDSTWDLVDGQLVIMLTKRRPLPYSGNVGWLSLYRE